MQSRPQGAALEALRTLPSPGPPGRAQPAPGLLSPGLPLNGHTRRSLHLLPPPAQLTCVPRVYPSRLGLDVTCSRKPPPRQPRGRQTRIRPRGGSPREERVSGQPWLPAAGLHIQPLRRAGGGGRPSSVSPTRDPVTGCLLSGAPHPASRSWLRRHCSSVSSLAPSCLLTFLSQEFIPCNIPHPKLHLSILFPRIQPAILPLAHISADPNSG